MQVQLDYFNPDSGAWYARGSFETGMTLMRQVASEVKYLMQHKELPTLNAGHARYTVLITFGDLQHIMYAVEGDR